MAMQTYSSLRSMDGDPWTRLQAAVIFQAFDDYVTYCKLASGRRKVKGDFTREPTAELAAIREYITSIDDPETGALSKALDVYCVKRHVRDILRASA